MSTLKFKSGKKPQMHRSYTAAVVRARKINWLLLSITGALGNLQQQLPIVKKLILEEPEIADDLDYIHGRVKVVVEALKNAEREVVAFNRKRKAERKSNGNSKG